MQSRILKLIRYLCANIEQKHHDKYDDLSQEKVMDNHPHLLSDMEGSIAHAMVTYFHFLILFVPSPNRARVQFCLFIYQCLHQRRKWTGSAP